MILPLIHSKKTFSSHLSTSLGEIQLKGPMTEEELKQYPLHSRLDSFRRANQQHQALIEIANLEEGRVNVAISEKVIIGYVTFLHPPDPIERWSTFYMENLLELGAIEIAPSYRGIGLGSKLIELSVTDPFMENYIIISTEYYWHWDLNNSKLSVWDYRKIMEKMMFAGGLTPPAPPTNDPEIMAHPANCLMVRIGKNVREKDRKLFDQLRFLNA